MKFLCSLQGQSHIETIGLPMPLSHRNCYGNGDCISGTCHCFLGFLGPDCGRACWPLASSAAESEEDEEEEEAWESESASRQPGSSEGEGGIELSERETQRRSLGHPSALRWRVNSPQVWSWVQCLMHRCAESREERRAVKIYRPVLREEEALLLVNSHPSSGDKRHGAQMNRCGRTDVFIFRLARYVSRLVRVLHCRLILPTASSSTLTSSRLTQPSILPRILPSSPFLPPLLFGYRMSANRETSAIHKVASKRLLSLA
ncbi:Teneurin-4, partial [Ophiophagus hannah]